MYALRTYFFVCSPSDNPTIPPFSYFVKWIWFVLFVWNNSHNNICCDERRRCKCIFRITREREHLEENSALSIDFKEFLDSWNEIGEIEDITPVELLKTIIKEGVLAVSIFLLKPAFHFLLCIFITLVMVVTQTAPAFFYSRIFILKLLFRVYMEHR